jgi:hypothetical protein
VGTLTVVPLEPVVVLYLVAAALAQLENQQQGLLAGHMAAVVAGGLALATRLLVAAVAVVAVRRLNI